jgi:hypothetical protein
LIRLLIRWTRHSKQRIAETAVPTGLCSTAILRWNCSFSSVKTASVAGALELSGAATGWLTAVVATGRSNRGMLYFPAPKTDCAGDWHSPPRTAGLGSLWLLKFLLEKTFELEIGRSGNRSTR